VVKIDHTRIDKYNSTGVLLDGATGDTPPLTPSGAVTQGTLSQDQIVGRTLCVDFLSNGDCSNPTLAVNGPLYGQDGLRVTAGSTAALTQSTITQNIVQGTGAPVRSTNTTPNSTSNDKLTMASDVRLIGAGASTFSQNNFVDSSYGLINVLLDGTTANTAVPAKAENNWWGLRFNAQTANAGPAISPTSNPPTPEAPVNGSPVADGTGMTSDAVDFFPYRNGFQSDPDAGELPIVDVPGPVNDAAPSVDFSTDKATYHRGDTVRLTATPADDFGVRSVSFYDGPWLVASSDDVPYTTSYVLPADVGCAPRTLTAVVEDSSGQTASKSHAVGVDAADCVVPTPTPTPQPGQGSAPSVAFANPPLKIPTRGADVTAVPNAPAGLRHVDFFLGTRSVCSLRAAPFTCRIAPTGADVGLQSLRVVVTDAAGQTAEAATRVEIARFAPRKLSLSTASRRTGRRVRKTISGRLRLPTAVTAAQGCGTGTVTLVTSRAGKLIDDTQVKLSKTCTFRHRLTVARGGKRNAYRVIARFGGNQVLLPLTASRRFS
jgi:hypothetical protein